MNYVLQILQFSGGGDFWRFLGCWFIISTLVVGVGNMLGALAAILTGARKAWQSI